MEIELLRSWARTRKQRFARVVNIDDVPAANRAEVILTRKGKAVAQPPDERRCKAAIPRSNMLGRCFFVRCSKPIKSGPWCHVHRGGQKMHPTRGHDAKVRPIV